MDYKDLANLIFPDAKDISYYEEKYPERDLPEGAVVTRFAPSPTGFVHIGGLYQALVARTIAEKTGGVHTINMILNNLSNYEIDIFYYGEDENKNYKFNNQIKNVYYEDLRNKKKYSRLKSLLIGKTYSSYMYNKDSDVLNSILSSNIYDVIIYDQYSSMDFNIKTNSFRY